MHELSQQKKLYIKAKNKYKKGYTMNIHKGLTLIVVIMFMQPAAF